MTYEPLPHVSVPESRKKSSMRILFLVVNALFAFISLYVLWRSWNPHAQDLDRLCNSYTSYQKSPVWEDIDIKYSTIQRDGSFFDENIYRGPASKEVDMAWEALGTNYRAVLIPEAKAIDFGLSGDNVKQRLKDGGGILAYVDAMHLLHCLNLLRKASYFNYDYYANLGQGPFGEVEPKLRLHVTHCYDILRQDVMCTADTGLLGSVWVRGYGAFPDFNTKHECKNFDDIRHWVESNQYWGNDTAEFRSSDILHESVP